MIPIYRIWDKRTGKWMNVQEAIISNGEVYETWRDFEDGLSLTEDDYVFVHSTGLKDKNGVEIFEGDIVKVTNHPFQKKEDSAGIEIDGDYLIGWSDHNLTWLAGDLLLYQLKPYIEVIGNIYENPELLEVEG